MANKDAAHQQLRFTAFIPAKKQQATGMFAMHRQILHGRAGRELARGNSKISED
jgi:hypothetical protein